MATIRINDNDKKRLDRFCREMAVNPPEVFHLALAALEKQCLTKRIKLDFEALALDAEALQAYKDESEMFDQASFDGLILVM